jgi:hypothetical protein
MVAFVDVKLRVAVVGNLRSRGVVVVVVVADRSLLNIWNLLKKGRGRRLYTLGILGKPFLR